MVEGDLFREVDEDLRHERIAKIWEAYGVYVLIGAFLIIASVAGYKTWQWWSEKQAAENGEAFVKVLALGEDGKTAEMNAGLKNISQHGTRGYAVLAKLHLAAQYLSEGKNDEAAAEYNSVANDGFISQEIRSYALIQAAALALDKSSTADTRKRLQSLNEASSPWRFSARELIGLAAYKEGAFGEAEELFQQIAGDSKAPAQMRRRAETMLALLVKPAPQPSDKAKEPARDEAKTQ
jgi:hypothetical protein